MVHGKLSHILSVPIYYRLLVFSMSSYINNQTNVVYNVVDYIVHIFHTLAV